MSADVKIPEGNVLQAMLALAAEDGVREFNALPKDARDNYRRVARIVLRAGWPLAAVSRPAEVRGEADTLDGADLDTLEGVKRWMRNFFSGCDQPSADDLIERFEQILRRDIAQSPDEVAAAYEAGFAFAKAHYTQEAKADVLAALLAYNTPRLMRVSGPLVDGMETDIRFLKVFTEDDIREAIAAPRPETGEVSEAMVHQSHCDKVGQPMTGFESCCRAAQREPRP